MAGPSLEIFKFGLYIFFPIAVMHYFGTNLDRRFSVPDFWPTKQQSHQIPFDRDELRAERERIRKKRQQLLDRKRQASSMPQSDISS